MRLAWIALALMLCALPLAGAAQQSGVQLTIEDGPSVADVGPVATAVGARLRVLDKTVGRSNDLTLANGETSVLGRISVQLLECRYPEESPDTDAYAHLRITDLDGVELFNGWMIASSPALSALEHPRYDVWVLRCNTSSGGTEDG
ncbi:DUF2155 domain-containing protein [Nioella nitratireducens]|uniref:DUF2155 domain-containing protein n=1 Tax=Nioella nitratireducens TaxID=1287720 RepID=UPI0008FD0DB2|nr:DUF2155 domain-containing protein [Nioella nitratireducens]